MAATVAHVFTAEQVANLVLLAQSLVLVVRASLDPDSEACLPLWPCLCRRLGLPTSSSQCITGGIVGVGMMDGWKSGVNWKLFGKQVSHLPVTYH
jgi:phosphate/sulfate permease